MVAPWCAEGSKRAVSSSHKTPRVAWVQTVGCITVPSGDHTRRGDVSGGRDCGARHIDDGEVAVGLPQEAVRHATCILVRSDDDSSRGDGNRRCGCGARWIERYERVGQQQLRQREDPNSNEYISENSLVVHNLIFQELRK